MSRQHIETFVERCLPPDDGKNFYIIAYRTLRPRLDKVVLYHDAFRTRGEFIDRIARLLRLHTTRDVYVAMACFKEAELCITASGSQFYRGRRKQDNAAELKSLFLDCDVKEKGGYPTTADAVAAFNRFLGETSLPTPPVVVSTGEGHGFHAHWPLTETLTPSEWQPLANALAEAAERHGLKIDACCTVDSARILRPPSALNWKPLEDDPPASPTSTTLVRCAPGDLSVDEMRTKLAPYMIPRRAAPVVSLNSDLIAGLGGGVRFDVIRDLVTFLAKLPDSPFKRGTYEPTRDLMFGLGRVTRENPELEPDVRALVDEFCALVPGRVPEVNHRRVDEEIAREDHGENDISIGTTWRLAIGHGWTPPAGAANGNTAKTPLDPKQEHALAVAKRRLNDAFLIARKIGRHRIRGDLVREARLVPDGAVRARLMFALAAALMKSGHPAPEIVDAIIACGVMRAHAALVATWAAMHIEEGNAA